METNLMQSPLTYSRRRARVLLAAWNSADLSRLEAVLDSPSSSGARSFEEEERMEMVAEVECSLRTWLDRTGASNAIAQTDVALFAALKLLRHLAGCEASANSYRAPKAGIQVVGDFSFDYALR
ncbi:MAG TPA: hypothetical protein VGN17_09835 [Bryobacteraceae bacterium]